MKPVEEVVKDIQEAEKYNDNSKWGVERKSYFFVDDNLYVNREYTKKLFKAMAGLGIEWDGQGTMNTASDPEVLDLMAASGCRSFSFGFESISPVALAEAKKPKCNVVEDYSKVIDILHEHGIAAGGFFIVGFDGDDPTVFEELLKFLKDMNMFQSIVSLLTPYPGTELHERINGEGRIFTSSWEKYNSWTCVFTPKRMSAEDLQAGFHWLGIQISTLDHIKKVIAGLWETSYWSKKPSLTLIERLILLFIAQFKLPGKLFKPFRNFLRWAATRSRARDFRFIMWAMLRKELASYAYYATYYNPAERQRQAELAKQAEPVSLPTLAPGQLPAGQPAAGN
jgi:radical SAM superfamily enzyme YgiQ (UPF0313 family)